jgi:hypothetical protein
MQAFVAITDKLDMKSTRECLLLGAKLKCSNFSLNASNINAFIGHLSDGMFFTVWDIFLMSLNTLAKSAGCSTPD